MVSIIKNQLLKHLSRFTKNLSADRINLSTFKGEGELCNLELDEIVLTDLLELPSWLRLTSAWCNKVAFRIQWTKLKSVPIFLSLDEVLIEVETCEELRSMSAQHGLSSYMAPAKYSFINKVIDGITVAVNTVKVTFKSPAFIASVQMSRIMVESKSPSWARGDLRITRLKDSERGQLLIFKELEWQTVRIEAKSTLDENLTPLRLLTNQARCRITIKKRISDCFIMGSRLVLILDDLLWVLTDSQLKAALCFLDSLSGLVQKSTELTRIKKAARKLEELPEYQAQISQQNRTKESDTPLSRIFARYDVVETSYHFLSQRIDLHLCDDPGAGRSVHPDLQEGAALQISIQQFQVDYYPYHLAIGDRKHWPKYRESASPHSQWLNQALASFRTNFLDLIEQGRVQHMPLNRSTGAPQSDSAERSPTHAADMPRRIVSPHATGNPVKNYILVQLAKLMTSCVILRVQDFTLYQVTTCQRKQVPKEFIAAQQKRKQRSAGDRDRFNLPEEVTILHAEFTYYYYPGDNPFPLPPPKFYVQLNPVQIHFDVFSCLWLNAFLLNLHQSLLSAKTEQQPATLTYVDVKLEAIMPRIIFDSSVDHSNQKDRPKSLHLQVSRASITNVRSLEHSSRADLAKCVDALQLGSLFYGAEFPAVPGDFHVVTEKFLKHISGSDYERHLPGNVAPATVGELERMLCRDLLWTEAKDVWCVSLDPVWGDFVGAPATGSNKSVPFLDAFPLTLWVHVKLPGASDNASLKSCNGDGDKCDDSVQTADIHALAHISNLVSVQLNHYQYLFLLRLSEELTELATVLALDSNRILKQKQSGSMVIGALLPQVEVTFVMPSMSPGKECSGGDLESVIPDSASLQEDNVSLPQGVMKLPLTPGSEVSSLCIDLQHQQRQHHYQQQQQLPQHHQQQHHQEQQQQQQLFHLGDKIEYQIGECTYPVVSHRNGSGPSPTAFPGLAIPNNFNAGLSSVKKGFSNLMTSLDSALKASPDDASDTASLRSDASSDSENFVVVNYSGDKTTECLDAMFRVTPGPNDPIQPLEVASEVLAEDDGTITTSPSERSLDSSSRRRDLVSMSTFKLGQVEFVQQSHGFSSIIKVQVANMASEECGAIPWDEFQRKFVWRSRAWMEVPEDRRVRPCAQIRLSQTVHPGELENRTSLPLSKFGCRSRAWMEVPVDGRGRPRARIRLCHTVHPGELKDRTSLRDWNTDHLEARISDLEMELNMSTVVGLADLVEDEIIPQPLPMQISLENIKVHLNEDRPSANITSPGPVPVHVQLSRLSVRREKDGVFHLEPLPAATVPGLLSSIGQSSTGDDGTQKLAALESFNRQLQAENIELKRRLVALERVSEENHLLRQSSKESQILRSVLAVAQDDVADLLEEKRSLLDRMKSLQEQLDQSHRSKR